MILVCGIHTVSSSSHEDALYHCAENKDLIRFINTQLKMPLPQWLKQAPVERTSLT